MNFVVPVDHRVKLKKYKHRDKYIDLARELKKTMELVGDIHTNYNWCVRCSHQRIVKGTRQIGDKNMSGDQLNYSIIKINHNTKNIPRVVRRLTDSNPRGKPSIKAGLKKTLKRIIIKIIIVKVYQKVSVFSGLR